MDSKERSELETRLQNDEQALITALNQVKRHEQLVADNQAAVAALQRDQQAILNFAARSAQPFVGGGEVLPPVGIAADFWDPAYAAGNPFYTGADLRERLERDRLAVPDFANNEGYTPDGKIFPYWVFGLSDYFRALAACESQGVDPIRVFDFGGSTGRVFRQFYCQDRAREVWSCDFKDASVKWCLKYLPGDIRVFLNTFLPHLPLADGYFDLVTAYSVFTHIDELETSWLLELKRILRPGGVAYLTIHDDTTWRRMGTESDLSGLADAVRRSPGGSNPAFADPIPQDRSAYHFSSGSHYNCNVFHSQAYIRRNWARFFEIAAIVPTHHWEQAVVVCVNR